MWWLEARKKRGFCKRLLLRSLWSINFYHLREEATKRKKKKKILPRSHEAKPRATWHFFSRLISLEGSKIARSKIDLLQELFSRNSQVRTVENWMRQMCLLIYGTVLLKQICFSFSTWQTTLLQWNSQTAAPDIQKFSINFFVRCIDIHFHNATLDCKQLRQWNLAHLTYFVRHKSN